MRSLLKSKLLPITKKKGYVKSIQNHETNTDRCAKCDGAWDRGNK